MFVDKVKISVKAGNGGNGAVAFHREKYVAAGGPDGGDGGHGGNVVLRVNDNLSTLMDFRYKRKYTAPNGQDGQGARCHGKRGENLVIQVPRGTVVRDAATGEIIKDMSDSEDFILCKGGRGGWGNKHFATPTRQAPRFAKSGGPGEEHEVILELKLLADVGLVGFPNVGKSTLLSATSNARPKIANYHFTTLYPNLGVIYVEEGVSFVMADIPGIIEGAAEGAGLGHDFLRHIDRCRLMVHIVDVSGCEGRDPVEDFEKINAELREYSPELAQRPMLVAANKCDLLGGDTAPLERLRSYVTGQGYEFFEISAATTQGTKQLMQIIAAEYRNGNYVIAGGDFNQTFEGADTFPVLDESTWQPGKLYNSELPAGFSYVFDASKPTCRLLDKPYDGDRENAQLYVIDGFIVSDNLKVNLIQTVDLNFQYSDHNPVLLQVTPQ